MSDRRSAAVQRGVTVVAGVGPRSATHKAAGAPHIARGAVVPRSGSLVAVVFTTLMVLIPWPAIWLAQNGTPLEDRRVYESQIVNGFLVFDRGVQGDLWSYVSGEYLWGWLLNLFVRELSLPVAIVFAAISAFVLFVAAKVILRHAHPAFLLFLLNPSFVNLAFSQLRIALAMALVAAAYLLKGKLPMIWVLRVSLLTAACFVHTSMIIFVGLFIASGWIAHGNPERGSYASLLKLVVAGLAAVVLLGPLRTWFLSELGDRRVEADYLSSSVSFYLVWLLLAVFLIISWRNIQIVPPVAFAMACLVVVLAGLFFEVYVNRVIAIALPFFVVALAALPRAWRPFAIIAYVVFDVVYWIYWLNIG